MTFRLQTLGRLRLVDKNGREVAFPEKGLLILCHLIVGGYREQSRNDIAKLLWDEVVPSQAFVNLRKTISRISARQDELGCHFLSFSQSSVALDVDRLQSDLDEINRDPGDALTRFELAATTFQEDFLKDLKSQGQSLHGWIERQRGEHMTLLRESLIAAAPEATKTHRKLVKAAAARLLERNPLDEDVRKILTEVFQLEGNHLEARAIAHSNAPAIPAVAEWRPASPIFTPVSEAAADLRPPRVVLLPPSNGAIDSPGTQFASALIEDVTIGLCGLRSVSVIAPTRRRRSASRPTRQTPTRSTPSATSSTRA